MRGPWLNDDYCQLGGVIRGFVSVGSNGGQRNRQRNRGTAINTTTNTRYCGAKTNAKRGIAR
jgi:hypothetical protein